MAKKRKSKAGSKFRLAAVNITSLHNSDSTESGLAGGRWHYLNLSLPKSFFSFTHLHPSSTISITGPAPPSGLLLPSQKGYQSVQQAQSSRSTICCCYLENQPRYDTLTLIYSTSTISHQSNFVFTINVITFTPYYSPHLRRREPHHG